MIHNAVLNKYHVSRLGNKLCVDDQKVLLALPRDIIPERTWAEILQKEEAELIALELREEIVELALHEGYELYMERQVAPFAAHCAAKAWLQLIDWHFYCHDPGEDPTAHPPCYIPRRAESWFPDLMPEPSPKDSWAKQNLDVVEEVVDGLNRATSSDSIHVPVVEEIPREYWFPGKVQLPGYVGYSDYDYDSVTFDGSVSSDLASDSELLQKVTNYTPREVMSNVESISPQSASHSKKGTPEAYESPSSCRGGGDSQALHLKPKLQSKGKLLARSSMARSNVLPPLPLQSRSRISAISDHRLRSLRMDTQYEIAPEKIESPQKVNAKRK